MEALVVPGIELCPKGMETLCSNHHAKVYADGDGVCKDNARNCAAHHSTFTLTESTGLPLLSGRARFRLAVAAPYNGDLGQTITKPSKQKLPGAAKYDTRKAHDM